MNVSSAQVKSCILLAGLSARGRTEVLEEAGATRDHTERMLRWFNVAVESVSAEHDGLEKNLVSVEGPARLVARDVSIPGDISSAAFFLAAAALLPGSELELEAIGLNPTRAQILETLSALGAGVRATNLREECNEPVGDIQAGDAGPGGVLASSVSAGGEPHTLRGPVIARLIDELPILAVVGSQLPAGLEIRDAAELRVKESDRIRATVENLRRMGATVEEFADGMRIGGRARLRGAHIKTHGDHRIAMAFAVAALVAETDSELDDAGCARISFPEFFELLESVVER
jgi:3-phosphoshikimate 1-carboxyvinyltransferase